MSAHRPARGSLRSILLAALFAGVLLALSACGGGDGTPGGGSATGTARGSSATAAASGGSATGTTATSTTAASDDALCALLPERTINSVTGYAVTLVQPNNGPGFLHFCTIYLDVPGCNMECALSLEDVGEIDVSNSNTPDLFRQSFLGANPASAASFRDGVVGKNSWLAVAVSGPLPGWKLAYFQAKGRAYDLSGPRSKSGLLSEEQMIELARAVVSNVP